jgi:hypothetical protein
VLSFFEFDVKRSSLDVEDNPEDSSKERKKYRRKYNK